MDKDLPEKVKQTLGGLVDQPTTQTSASDLQDDSGGGKLIRFIKRHLAYNEPMVFHVIHVYAELPPRGFINRLLFWILAFIAQVIDMVLATVLALAILAVVLILVIAVMHGLGIDDLVINLVKQIQTL